MKEVSSGIWEMYISAIKLHNIHPREHTVQRVLVASHIGMYEVTNYPVKGQLVRGGM